MIVAIPWGNSSTVCDHNLWFWHTSYGYSGLCNDLNILNLSPLLVALTDGSFQKTEEESGVTPFFIGVEAFDQLYILVDGIYPEYSRFVRGMTLPTSVVEKRFTGWQESTRKDIERAFGVLQIKWKSIQYPILMMDLKSICSMVTTCLILHNMAVSDRIMGDARAVYQADFELADAAGVAEAAVADAAVADVAGAGVGGGGIEAGENEPLAEDIELINNANGGLAPTPGTVTLLSAMDKYLATTIATRRQWIILKSKLGWRRLQAAMIAVLGNRPRNS